MAQTKKEVANTNDATQNEATEVVNNAPTSPELEKIRAEIATKWNEAKNATSMEEGLKLNVEIFQLQQKEKHELANIAIAKAKAEAEEARNARLSSIDDLINAVAKVAKHKLSEEDKAKFAGERDKVAELVLQSAPKAPKAATASKGSNDGTSKGEESKAIVELYLQGKTHKEIEEMGHKRSTVWHAINNYKIAQPTA